MASILSNLSIQLTKQQLGQRLYNFGGDIGKQGSKDKTRDPEDSD